MSNQPSPTSANVDEIQRLIADAKANSIEARKRVVAWLFERLKHDFRARPLTGLSPARSKADIIQEASLIAHERFETFKNDTPSDLERWGRGIIRNLQLTSIRRRRGRSVEKHGERIWMALTANPDFPDPQRRPLDRTEWEEEIARVYSLLGSLKPYQQSVIRMRLFDEWSFKEIARYVRKEPDAVRIAYGRAIERLQELYRDGETR